jgi:signal transduction histidine kinase
MIATTLARHCLRPVFAGMMRWQNTSLSGKFAAAAASVMMLALAGLTSLVAEEFAEAAVNEFAAGVALYTDSVVAPSVQEIAHQSSISEAKRRELDSLFAPTVIRRPLVSFRIWVGNRILYSNSPEVIGKEFSPSQSRERAWNGLVASEIDQLDSDDDAPTRAMKLPILEVYAPLREAVTGRIFALAETHEIATELATEIRKIKATVWLVFAAVMLGFTSVLVFLVERGKRENDAFKMRLVGANRRVYQINESHMQRLATGLHSGPVQLVGLALLKLDPVREMIAKLDAPTQAKQLEAVRAALDRALEEISTLTETFIPTRINTLSIAETIDMAVRRHELKAGVQVNREIGHLPSQVTFPVKACIYKFILEAMSALQDRTDAPTLRARRHNHRIEVQIQVPANRLPSDHKGQWLEILRDDVGTIGGTLSVSSWFETENYTLQVQVNDLE